MDLESKLKIADRFNLIELKVLRLYKLSSFSLFRYNDYNEFIQGKIMQNLRTFDELRKIKRTEGLKVCL